MSTVLASTSNADGATLTSGAFQFDASNTIKATCQNPSPGPNTPCICNVQLSADQITWYTVDSRTFGPASGMLYIVGFALAKYMAVAPQAVMLLGGWQYARLVFTSNTGAAVTVAATDSVPVELAIVPLLGTASVAGGGIAVWTPPGGGPITIQSCNVYVTANSTGVCALSAGVAANATTSSTNLISAAALAAAAGTTIFSAAGATIASNQVVTFSGSATSAGLVAKAFIEYVKAA
jgi:hypothetical protein